MNLGACGAFSTKGARSGSVQAFGCWAGCGRSAPLTAKKEWAERGLRRFWPSFWPSSRRGEHSRRPTARTPSRWTHSLKRNDCHF